jgi:hypothetical protein
MAAADTRPAGVEAGDGRPLSGEELVDACLQIVSEGVGQAIANMRASWRDDLAAIDARLTQLDQAIARLDVVLARLEISDQYRTALSRQAAGLQPHSAPTSQRRRNTRRRSPSSMTPGAISSATS